MKLVSAGGLSLALMERAYGRAFNSQQNTNAQSIIDALSQHGERFGLLQPHRLAQFLAQLMHETGDFRFDRELWGPTPAQKRYDTRIDLGNTPEVDGDGFKNRGRGPIQVTGGTNIADFYAWCVGLAIGAVPDFRVNPDLINTDPWEGLSALWYWSTRNLNKWADQGDVETITVKINGGKNGFPDRVDRLGRMSLVLLGYGPEDVRRFQVDNGLDGDGDVGPKTRAAMHKALVALSPGEVKRAGVAVAPVTEEKAVAVTPPSLDAPWWRSKETLVPLAGGGGAALLNSVGAMPWQNLVIFLGFVGLAAGFLLWRKRADAKAVRVMAAAVEQ